MGAYEAGLIFGEWGIPILIGLAIGIWFWFGRKKKRKFFGSED